MKIFKLVVPSVAMTAALIGSLYPSSGAHAQGALTSQDLEAITATILRSETAPESGAWTIFVGLEGAEVGAMLPRLQAIYKSPTILKALGKDWGDSKEGCHEDKATGTGATGVFISAPQWRSPTSAAFKVTFSACAIGSHINTYIFDRDGANWVAEPLKRGPMS